jgi:molybdate transport repressor ModE-like protein
METGAVIVAAGMSSRMGDFKPMLNIGSISIAQRIIATLQQAGVTKIVVVTGFNADRLEHHLSKNGVIFLRNENYETTQMFDSAVIGLSYLRDKCSRALFTPVDIPLFTAGTVDLLMRSGADFVCPVYKGEQGHPIMISAEVVARIVEDSGEGGLKGALSRCGVKETFIEVNDEGVIHDADTKDDYRSLLEYHNRQILRPVVDVRLAKEKPFFDTKTAMLFFLIDNTQSVRKACKQMQISYSSGWNIINATEAHLGYPLIERSQGGDKGGKSTLTPAGKDLLRRYEKFKSEVRTSIDELFNKYFSETLI